MFDAENKYDVTFQINETEITSVAEANHLGNLLCKSNKKCVEKVTNDFTYKVNNLISVFDCAYADTKYTLFKSFAMPLYGSLLFDHSSKDMEIFWVRWRKCLRRF